MEETLGQLISVGVAVLWTVAALASEVGSRQLGVAVVNVWRLGLALVFSALLLWGTTGWGYPVFASGQTWMWLLLSGLVGYFFGDWCLFNSYVVIGSRMGQLFMTLAPMFTALAAWVMIGQTLTWSALLAMAVTLLGIAISVLGRDATHHVTFDLPRRGILFGIGAAVGQGVGLVLSKIGVDSYTTDLSPHLADLSSTSQGVGLLGLDITDTVPFAANMIRCVAGVGGFALWLVLSGRAAEMRRSVSHRSGMMAILIAVFSGPLFGVGFSLMAVQYTAAGIASTIMATTPIIILLPSRWLFRQPITPASVVGALVSVAGVSLFFLL